MEDQNPSQDADIEQDKGARIYPRSLFAYRPRVDVPLDLFVDMSQGVVLGRSVSFHNKYKSIGLGFLGAVAESSDDQISSLLGMPVNLDLVSPHVMFVAGKRGSGKSYSLGVIFEELALAMDRSEIEVAAVVVDTVDVFRQSVSPNHEQEELLSKWNLEASGLPVIVYIPKRTFNALPDDVRTKTNFASLAISPRELSGSDWGYVLEKGGDLSTTMDNLIGDVVDSLRRGYTLSDGDKVGSNTDFSIQDMIRCIESNPSITDFYKPATRTAMIQRLRRAKRLGIFHPGGTSAQDLAVAGQITIIDVAPLGSDAESVLAILTNMLCRQVLTYRMAWTDEGTSAREELPPTWLIIDEAHTLVPRSGHTPAKNAIIGYAKLGRRFGCSLVLCTQQPSAVSDDAISQADIIISHSLSHDADIRALQQRAPAVMPGQFRDKVFISSLPRGVAMVFDQSTQNKRGFIFQVRPRISQHGGTDRLSGILEAATLFSSDYTDAEDVIEEEDVDISEPKTDADDEVEELADELPSVPKPPLQLSKSDWDNLDGWIQEYIKKRFEEERQEYTISEEPAPHLGVLEDTPDIVEPIPGSFESSDGIIDSERVKVNRFKTLKPTLLSKAMTRMVLYTPPSHEYLFTMENIHRESIVVQLETDDPLSVLEMVSSVLKELEFIVHEYETRNDSTFVLLRKDEIRGALSVGVCGAFVSIPIVLVGTDSRKVTSVAGDIHSRFRH